jgi:hypothetical protein
MSKTVLHPPRRLESVDSVGDLRFWSTEVVGPVTILQFQTDSARAGVDLQRISTLWEFFDGLLASGRKVLHISIPSGSLSHDALVGLWEYFRSIPSDEYLPSARDSRAQTELAREDCALRQYITYVRDCRLFVVGDVQGEIDINFLGLLLACDYRIAAEDTVIVNSGHPLGMCFGTAVPWFLSQILGPSQTLEILLRNEHLPAQRAYELGIIHRLTAAKSHSRDALEITQSLAAKGPASLLALKRAMIASSAPVDTYLQALGAGFDRVPIATRFCTQCRYDLTGNVSGRCPECGRAIPFSKEPTK